MSTRWGIVSTGRISQDFVTALQLLPEDEHQVAAVGARSIDAAQDFAERFSIPKAYGSYQELGADPGVDVVYVGTIHLCHAETCKLMLNAGKHVLCEKPLCLNVREAQEVIQLAKEKKLFLMEGYWTQFFPAFDKLKAVLREGVIGDPVVLRATMGANMNERAHALDPALGGGALIDLGCYTVMMAYVVLGKPESITAVCTKRPKGNDETTILTLRYPGNKVAILTCSTRVWLDNRAFIHGPGGAIEIFQVWCPTHMKIKEEDYIFSLPEGTKPMRFKNNKGFMYEAQHVRERLLNGDLESPIVSHQMSLDILEIMDEARKEMGVVYPADKAS